MRRKILENKVYSFKEAEQFNIEFWRRQSAQVKFATTWHMISDFLKMRGKSGRLPRLRRSIQTIKYL